MNAILFDFGGTIDTDGVHWSEKFWELYERFHLNIPKPDFERAFVQSEAELLNEKELPAATFHQTLRKQLTLQFRILKLVTSTELSEQMVKACYEDVRQTIAGARTVLTELQKKYTLGVVSNFYGNLEVVCREFRLDTLFGAMIDSSVVGVRKPDPEIFRLALRQLGAPPAGSFIVGDSYERDIVPGKQVGCSTIWLKGKSWTTPASTAAADYTVLSLAAIRSLLL